MGRHYALTNPQEYFAESTEAYFSRNDFFPYDRAELEKHDPETAALIGKLWNSPDGAAKILGGVGKGLAEAMAELKQLKKTN